MRIINLDLNHLNRLRIPVCACIGYFDGMHLGHQALIEKTIEKAKEYACETALFTFDPDPWVTIKGLKDVKHITTLGQRIELASRFGIENIFVLQFTSQMANLSPTDFVDKVLSQCNLKALICGFDFHYGKMGAGNYQTLVDENKFEVIKVNSVNRYDEKISSTRISKLLEEGNIVLANELLGYSYELIGTVVHGRQVGRKLGFPTANIEVSKEYLLPKLGVYAAYVLINNQKYQAMLNFGHNPTINYFDEVSVEAHILDFDDDLYGQTIKVYPVCYLRPEIKFQHIDNLILQLEQDRLMTRKLLECTQNNF